MKRQVLQSIGKKFYLLLLIPLLFGCLDEILSGIGLSSITISPSSATVVKGLTTNFTAEGSYQDGSTRDITSYVDWSSNDTLVATITNGVATGEGTGQAEISATYQGINSSNTATITVTNNTATTVSFTNNFGRPIVYEVWNGYDLSYSNSQVIGYGNKVYSTIDESKTVADGSTDIATIDQDEEIIMLLVVVGVPHEGINYYMTDDSFSNLSDEVCLDLLNTGDIDQIVCP